MTDKIIRSICSINSIKCGIKKELNLVEMSSGQRLYHIGTWKNDKCIDGVYLSFDEMRRLKAKLDDIDKEITKEKANEKFQKDYIQQMHNGDVDLKRDKYL